MSFRVIHTDAEGAFIIQRIDRQFGGPTADLFSVRFDGLLSAVDGLVVTSGTFLNKKGDLPVFNGEKFQSLPAGLNGYVLTADSTQPNGVKWAIGGGGGLPPVGSKGDLLVFDGSSWSQLNVGSNGKALVANSLASTGVQWTTLNTLPASATKGDILVWNGSSWVTLPVGTNGQILEADSFEPTGLLWGTFEGLPATSAKGDGLFSNGSDWFKLAVGSNGTVLIADSTQTLGVRWGTVTGLPGSGTKGDVLVYNGSNWIQLGVGSNNQVLTADSAQSSGVKWAAVSGTLPGTAAKGDILAYDGSNWQKLNVGANNTILTADSAQTTGLKWSSAGTGLPGTGTKGDLLVFNGSAWIQLGVGSDTQILTADSAQASGVKWGTLTGLPASSTKGDSLWSNGSSFAQLGVGSNGQVIIADSAQTTGVRWATITGLPGSSTKGDLLVSNGTTFGQLSVGTNTYVLTADSTQPLGVKWAPATGGGGTFATIYSSTSSDNVITESSSGGPLTIKDAGTTIGSLFKIQNNGATINFVDAASSGTTITNSVVASATPTPILTLTGQAHTAATAATEFFDVNLNLARTVQFGTGTLALQRAFVVQAPTYGFVGASTVTLAATMAIAGPPAAGTNATLGTDILTAVSSNLLLDRAGLGTNSLPSLHIRNATASSGGTTIQKSPGILFEGSAWTGSVSQAAKCLWVQEPTNGATVVTGMSLYTSVNNAAAALHHKMGISTNATWPKEMQTSSQFRFRSTVADGATALPWAFDTSASYATAGATLFRINNNATEVFEVGTSGAGGPQQYMRIRGGNGERLAPAFAGNTASSAHCGYEIGNAFDYWLITCESTTASVGRGNGQINFMMTVPGGNFDVGGNTTTDPGVLWRWTKAVAANTVSKQVQLYNNTAATAGNQRYSPFLSFLGNGWKTNATAGSQTVEFSLGTVPIQGAAAPTGQFQFYSSINGAGPTQIGEITDTGSLRFNRLGGRGSAPTPTAGNGAGAGATVTLLSGSTDVSGVIQVVTAGTPTASQTIVTVAFAGTYEFAPHVILTPASDTAADLSGTSSARVIFANTTTGQFVVTAGSAALTTGVTYRWHYHVLQATA